MSVASARPALLIAVSGGSASGKSTLAETIAHDLQPFRTRLLREDDYYRDHGARPDFDPLRYNFDDVTSRDHDLLADHLRALKAGDAVQTPVYDFSTHRRTGETRTLDSADVILVEGIHVLANPEVCNLFDLTVYVSASADIRLARRLIRDVRERDRSLESVVVQYLRTVRPMHMKHVAPGRDVADVVIVNDAAEAEPELEALRPSFHKLAAPAVEKARALLAAR